MPWLGLKELHVEVMSAHRFRCSLPYTQDQLFDLAADVESYPEFVPWWVAAKVRKRENNVYYTDQIIRLAIVRKRFRSKTILHRPERIDVTATDGPIRNLHLTWFFDLQPGNGCQVSLAVELDLRSQLIQDLFEQTVIRAVSQIMFAFEDRAHRLYDGAPGSCITAGEQTSRGTVI